MPISSLNSVGKNPSGGFLVASGGNSSTDYMVGPVQYRQHTFTSTGTFQVISGSGNVDYLVVAGGGGGGGISNSTPGGGGGGAGGFLTGQSAVGVGTYQVQVGGGGAAGGFGGQGVNSFLVEVEVVHIHQIH